jgi:CHAD domain-containing protein
VRSESVADAIFRIMREQIVRARKQLTDAQAPIEKRIHDARKRFKETRAVVRLVRDPLGKQFGVENAWWRDAGRDFASARDAEAVIEALDKLELTPAAVRRTRRLLESRRDAAPVADITKAVALLAAAEERLALWPALPDSFEAIAGGLGRTYRDGRRAMKAARARRTARDYHEWRKRVKDHWYHAQLLRSVWPDVMKAYESELESLSRALGDHHDLDVLRGIVGPRAKTLLAAIDGRQAELETQAGEIGARVYAERPRTWLARIRNYWNAWRT